MYLNGIQRAICTPCPTIEALKNIVQSVQKEHRDLKLDFEVLKAFVNRVNTIGDVFLKHKDKLFGYYPDMLKYQKEMEKVMRFKEISDAEQILKLKFREPLGLNSQLLSIVQRLPKYITYLTRFKKELDEKEVRHNITKSIEMIDSTVKLGMDFIVIGSIKYSTEDIFQYGKIILKGEFNCRNLNRVLVLWFSHKIIISLVKYSGGDVEYIFKARINESDLAMRELPGLCFEIYDYSLSEPKYYLTADSKEDKDLWIKHLNDALFAQLKKCKDEQIKTLRRTLPTKFKGVQRFKTK